MYLKTGYWKPVQYRNGAKIRYTHRYYPTVNRACQLCAELRAIRDQYNLTNKQLLYQMKKADPNLTRRSIRVKKAFTPNELQRRAVRASTLYTKCCTQPDWRDRTYFIDECSIWLDNEACKGTRVYCNAFDNGYQTVIHFDKLPHNQPIKVRFMAAVNAVHGLVYLELTTGTTSITRLHNLLPLHPQHGPYKVGQLALLLFGNDNVAKSSSANPKP